MHQAFRSNRDSPILYEESQNILCFYSVNPILVNKSIRPDFLLKGLLLISIHLRDLPLLADTRSRSGASSGPRWARTLTGDVDQGKCVARKPDEAFSRVGHRFFPESKGVSSDPLRWLPAGGGGGARSWGCGGDSPHLHNLFPKPDAGIAHKKDRS